MGAMDAFVGPSGQLMGLKVKPPGYPPLPPPRPPNLGKSPTQTTPAPYEPGNAPQPTDPNAPQPMEPYDPFGPLSGGGGGDGAGSAASSGSPGRAMPPYDPYISSPNFGPNYGYVGSGGDSFGGYGSSAVNALNDAFVASGLNTASERNRGPEGIGAGPYTPSQTRWDTPTNTYGGSPNIPSALAASNLARYAQAFQNFSGAKNPGAGFAASTVSGAESSGNPFALNQGVGGRPGSGAFGMNQWMNTPGSPRLTNMLDLTGGNLSPEMQAAFAASEIMGGGYQPTWNALNNPNASVAQMQRPLITNFEGLGGDPRQTASDVAGAARYARTQSAFYTSLRNNVAQGAGL